MDRIKSALKDLEIYNELYCTRNSHLQPGRNYYQNFLSTTQRDIN